MMIWYILAVILLLFLSTEFYAWKTGVPTIASFPSARRTIITALQAELAKRSSDAPYIIIDLGSGNGQLANKIARVLPQTQVTGIEISPVPWFMASLRQKLFGPRNLTFKRVDFWDYDCSQTDAVVTFLTENIIERVRNKLQAELKENAIVLANDTALRGQWQAESVLETGLLKMKVFVYRKKRGAINPATRYLLG